MALWRGAGQIKVIVHPDYICHSLVEFKDGSIITELGMADMRRYTQYALFHPERVEATVSSFTDLYGKTLRFEKPAFEKFPCLAMGYRVLELGGIMPAVLHGADHVAVEAFIEKKIGFMEIPEVISRAIDKTENIENPSIEQIIEAEKKSEKNSSGGFENMVSVVITAAGNSTRFGENKLLLEIAGRPMIVRTVEQFAKCSKVEEIWCNP